MDKRRIPWLLLKISLITFTILLTSSCILPFRPPLPSPDPPLTPSRPYIPIPPWIKSVQDIERWLHQEKCQYSPDTTLGYRDYYLSPAEFLLYEIPDVYRPGRTITKLPFHGDCEDFAIFTAYVMKEALGLPSFLVIIAAKTSAHAFSYAVDTDGINIYDAWIYRGKFTSLSEFIQRFYPEYKVVLIRDIETELNRLFQEGHVKYFPPQQ